MSFIGRLAKGIGATALTGNLMGGITAAATNSFTTGTAFGVAGNLMNPFGMMGGMGSMYGMGGMGMGSMYGMGGMGMGMSPFGGGFGYNPIGFNAWSNPMMMGGMGGMYW